jgi:hypothetical protein
MNLGKLLGAGKSFISGGKPAAYRTDKRVYLPQFISPKNPFANSAPAPVQTGASRPAGPSSAGPTRKATPPPWAKTRDMSSAEMPGQSSPTRVTTWASKFNPVAIFREVAAAPVRTAPPVQTELSLERVRVVHNDLTDADVEVVPMKSRPAREPADDAAPAAKKAWADLGERIMKATAL